MARVTPDAERRFLVLYYPRGVRSWPFIWRVIQAPPQRCGLFHTDREAEAEAIRWLRRGQRGFRCAGWSGVLQAWGWEGPPPMPDRVLIAEFVDQAAAQRPDVSLEPEAWMAGLDLGRALEMAARCDGTCCPPCAHCRATDEEVRAAREWLVTHRREVRASRGAGAARC